MDAIIIYKLVWHHDKNGVYKIAKGSTRFIHDAPICAFNISPWEDMFGI